MGFITTEEGQFQLGINPLVRSQSDSVTAWEDGTGSVTTVAAGIAIVSHDQGISDGGGSLTISSFACNATNDYIVVAIASNNNALIPTVTYASAPAENFTQLVGYYGANNTCSIWGLIPTATSGNIVITSSAGRDVLAVAYCLSGVDQSTPSEDTDLDYGPGTSSSITLTHSANGYMFDAVAITADVTNVAWGADQTVLQHDLYASSSTTEGAFSVEGPISAGNNTVTTSWTESTAFWSCAVAIKPAT